MKHISDVDSVDLIGIGSDLSLQRQCVGDTAEIAAEAAGISHIKRCWVQERVTIFMKKGTGFSKTLKSGLGMTIQTVSFLSENANNLELDDPLHTAQNAKQAYGVQSAESQHQLQETIALLKLIDLSEKSLLQRGEISIDEAFI